MAGRELQCGVDPSENDDGNTIRRLGSEIAYRMHELTPPGTILRRDARRYIRLGLVGSKLGPQERVGSMPGTRRTSEPAIASQCVYIYLYWA